MNGHTNQMKPVSLGGVRNAARDGIVNLFTLPERILETLTVWQTRTEERRHLRSLDARTLNDVGLTRADIQREASKPFWIP